MSLIDLLLIVLYLGLALWVIQLKLEIKRITDKRENVAPPPQQLSTQELRQLQQSMAELVASIESYTESQVTKIRLQSEAVSALCQRVEQRLKQPTPSPPQYEPLANDPPIRSARIVPLNAESVASRHKERDRVIDLHQRGWSPEKIAKELRITKGEVHLIVNLA